MADAQIDDESDDYQILVKVQRLKAAMHYTVGRICEQQEQETGIKCSKQFIAALNETVFKYSEVMAKDLESYAKHAKRTTINCDDVLLLARRNSSLMEYLKSFAEQQAVKREEQTSKRREKKKKSDSAFVDKIDNDTVDMEDSNL